MEISEDGKDFIKRREALVLQPHWDAIGQVWDIGYGHVFKPNEPRQAITNEEADALFDVDILYYVDQVASGLQVELDQWKIDALVSFCYNVGSGAFLKSTMLGYINEQRFPEACIEMLTWRRASGKYVEGLLNRRAHEVLIFTRGEYL